MGMNNSATVPDSSQELSWYRKAFGASSTVGKVIRQLRPVLGLVLITIAFMVLAPTYRQWAAIKDILEQSAVLLIMASGTTIVLISGGLDLSIGSILALVAVAAGSLLLAGAPIVVVVVVSLAVGTFVGFLNGFIVVKTGVPSLVVTLGMMMIARGVALMIGAGKDMSRFPDAFSWLGSGFVGPVLITALAVLVVWFILSKTRLGFNAYAIGGNAEVARLSGIPVKFNRVIFYSIGGFMAALSSIVQTARLDFATPNRGEGMELQAIAAVVIGGTSMFGGVGGVGRTVIDGVMIDINNVDEYLTE